MEVKTTGRKAKKETSPATEEGERINVTGDIVDTYKAYEAKARSRGASGGDVSGQCKVVIEELMDKMGTSELNFAATAAICSDRIGHKVYNQLRSMVKAKSSEYDLSTDADGHVTIIRK